MKKSLIALAVAGALTAPMVAQADATLYGKLEAVLQAKEDNDVDLFMDDVIFGLKGSAETSVEGLTAIYKMEVELNEGKGPEGATSEDSSITTRYAYVGATGAFGTVLAGRIANPTDVVEGYGDVSNKAGALYYNADRVGSALAYLSPSMSGFDFYVATVMDGSTTGPDAEDVDAYIIGANYMVGDLSLSVGYWDMDSNGTDTYSTYDNNILVGGSYAFGPLTLGLAYEQASFEAANTDDYKLYGISAVYTAGAAAPYIQYSEAEQGSADADEWALGLNYALGKKAGVGIEYSSVDSDTGFKDEGDQFNVSYTVKF
ncbi:porin [Neptunomonas phycophila]|uniref:Porin n=1 Tax=Neptunomonas phycophila TaxID=1572645 RepID=A0ABT9ES97_9GAMM|nr:porin [Neptunomonas phycophila]MDP2521834.1 porin [Neptunomonas phycophila]